VVCTATFMLLLDITVVNVALPDIARDLHSSFSDLQWVVDAYALSLASLMLTAGSLADLLGRRTVFVAGLGLFTLASLLCGLAGSPLQLNLARALQGVGGAAMFATSLALIAQSFHGRERGTAFGLWGATIGGAVAVGPLVGGALTQGIAWEAIFYVNIPIGVAAIAGALRFVADLRDPDATGVDWAGLVTFSAGLFFLVFALVRGNVEGWGSTIIVAFLLAAAALLLAFLVVERRQRRPMLDLSLFRKPAFAGASIVAVALSASMFAMFLYITLYLQNSLGLSPFSTGLKFLPLTLVSFAVAPISGRLSARIPVRALMGAGLALVGCGLLLMGGLDAHSQWTALLAGFIVAGAGIGMVNPALASTAVGVVAPQRAGMASGINNTFRQVGIATGIAGLGALFEHLLSSRIPDAVGGFAARIPVEALASGDPAVVTHGRTGAAAQVLRDRYLTGYTDALNELFVVGAVVAFAGALLALSLVRRRDFVASAPPVAAA